LIRLQRRQDVVDDLALAGLDLDRDRHARCQLNLFVLHQNGCLCHGDAGRICEAGAFVLDGVGRDDLHQRLRRHDAAADIVNNAGEASSSGKVIFGTNIDTDQLWFRQDGNDLVVDIIGTDDSVTIDEWYTGTANTVAEFETSNGSSLTAAKVVNLVSAMAAMTEPETGETELSASSLSSTGQTSLLATIANEWSPGA